MAAERVQKVLRPAVLSQFPVKLVEIEVVLAQQAERQQTGGQTVARTQHAQVGRVDTEQHHE